MQKVGNVSNSSNDLGGRDTVVPLYKHAIGATHYNRCRSHPSKTILLVLITALEIVNTIYIDFETCVMQYHIKSLKKQNSNNIGISTEEIMSKMSNKQSITINLIFSF